jgi:hypothetical protein
MRMPWLEDTISEEMKPSMHETMLPGVYWALLSTLAM